MDAFPTPYNPQPFAASATTSDTICETFPPIKLPKSLAQHVFVHSTARAASGQPPVYHHGGQTANAMLGSPARHLTLMHVMNVNLVLRPCQLLTVSMVCFAGKATRAENRDFVLH